MTTLETAEVTGTGIGARVKRVEDRRLLEGRGRYLADTPPRGAKHLGILRSPMAHARIRGIDVSAALALPGVHACFTGLELAAVSRPFSHLLPMPTIKPLEWGVLARDKVRYVGEPLAVVVADDRYLAEDALDLIEVDYEDLEVVVDPVAALESDAPLLYEGWGSNEFLSAAYSTGDVDGAFAAADFVLRERIVQHRVTGLPLEGHGAWAHYEGDQLVVYASNQQPHNLRTVLSDVTGVSEANLRVVAPDMGGGFGNKQHFMREEALVAVVAMQVPYPVIWTQDRSESLTSGIHSRGQIHEVEVACTAEGRILALRADLIADMGNPELYFTGAAPALVTTTLMTGVYDIPNYAYTLRCAVTNKCQLGAYRGFGQPQAFFTIERVMDILAERLSIDPVEIRRRNHIPDAPRPFMSPAGFLYDTGSFDEQLEMLVDEFDYANARNLQAEARADGRYVGIGIASMVEATAPNLHGFAGRFGGFEMAMVAVQPDGHVNIAAGTKSQGQGHETSLAQIASEVFTIPVSDIAVQEGDTSVIPYGMGTWGSRSAVMGGGAVLKAATELRDRMTDIAAHMLQAALEDVELRDGMFHAGEAVLPFAAVASAAYLHTFLLPAGTDMGLCVIASYDPGNTSPFPDEQGRMNPAATYATAAGAVLIEVDINTGEVAILDSMIVHDCGRIINPMIVDGQIQGAYAQAVGAVFLEEIVYGDDGQLLTSSLLDYLVPTFGSVPKLRIAHRETPSPLLGGFRGAGEGALIVMPAAFANAVDDALRPLGVQIRQSALSAPRLRTLLREAGVTTDALAGMRVRGVNLPVH